MTNQILDFGLPAPIDLQVVGRDPKDNYLIAQQLLRKVVAIPGIVDAHIHQQVTYPTIQMNVDRNRAEQLGLTQNDVTRDMLIFSVGHIANQSQPVAQPL